MESNFKELHVQPDKSTVRPENGYSDKTYGFVGREFDLEPYRSAGHRGTDYSSDSGRSRNSRKSSDFELEIPSPDTSRSQSRSQNEELYNSPTKSHLPGPEYLRDNHAAFDDPNKQRHLSEYRHISRSEPNLDKYQKVCRNEQSTDDEDTSPRHVENNREADANPHGPDKNEDSIRLSYVSPNAHHGEVGDTTLAHRDTKLHLVNNKASDLTHWQQKQRNPPVPEHNKLTPLSELYHNEVHVLYAGMM